MSPIGELHGVEAGILATQVALVEQPPPVLLGWQGLCAGEYALAALRLRAALLQTTAALATAAALLAAEP